MEIGLFDKIKFTDYDETQKENHLLLKLNSSKKKELIKFLKLKKIIQQNLLLYEKLLLEQKKNNVNNAIIQDTIEKLLAQKILLEHKINYIKESYDINNENLMKTNQIKMQKNIQLKNNMNYNISKTKNSCHNSLYNIQINNNNITDLNPLLKEETKLNSLKEIFDNYSKIHNYKQIEKGIFSSINEKTTLINLSGFSKFCSEFLIKLSRQKLVEIFRKTSSNLNQLNFNEFLIAIEKLSLAMHENKKQIILKNIMKNKKQLKIIDINKKNKINEEISLLQIEYEKLKNKTFKEIMEIFYEYLNLYNKTLYRKKMKEFTIPFNKKLKIKKLILKNDNAEIKRIIELKKKEKQKVILSQKEIQKNLLYQYKLKLIKDNNYQLQHSIKKSNENCDSNLIINNQIEKNLDKTNSTINIIKNGNEINNKKLEENSRISWEKLDELNINDLKLDENDKKILDDSYNSEDEDLLLYLNYTQNKSQDKKLIKNLSTVNLKYKNMKLPIINQNKIVENNFPNQNFLNKRFFTRNNSELNFINKKINMHKNSIKLYNMKID